MGKIVGNKKKAIISFTQEEVKEITSDLNKKVAELTEKVIEAPDKADKKAKKEAE